MPHNASQSNGAEFAFDEELTLAPLTETTLLIFTNNTRYAYFIDVIRGSGQAEALFRVLYKSNTIYKHRTSGSNHNMILEIPNGLLLKPSESIEIKVTNCHDTTADFSGAFIMHRTW